MCSFALLELRSMIIYLGLTLLSSSSGLLCFTEKSMNLSLHQVEFTTAALLPEAESCNHLSREQIIPRHFSPFVPQRGTSFVSVALVLIRHCCLSRWALPTTIFSVRTFLSDVMSERSSAYLDI